MEITLLDNKDIDSESMIMLQAFYSRNHKPIKVRVNELNDNMDGIKKSLEKWMIQYNHRSIGQCGGFTLFIENVSILAAKAIQDTNLYNGIETSTRYINFSNQEMYEPTGTDKAKEIQNKWLEFYTANQDIVLDHVLTEFKLDKNDPIQLKTAKARMFDIMRGFLPAGCKTQLSWFTTFDHANERLVQLLFHPLFEVREIANTIIAECKEKYKFAFSGIDKDIERYGSYYEKYGDELNYFLPDLDYKKDFNALNSKDIPIDITNYNDVENLNYYYSSSINNRPKGIKIPREFDAYGNFYINYILDYGSFRDIQRHRSCSQMIPVLTTEYGMHDWYINSLPESIRLDAKKFVYSQVLDILELKKTNTDIDLQYIIPLGFKVNCMLHGNISSLVYISEIRSGKTVHPTLRVIAKELANYCKTYVNIYDDQSEDELDLRRGNQDIVLK